MIEQEEYKRISSALEQYIPVHILRNVSLSAKIMQLIKLSERMYSGVMILDGYMRMAFQAEIFTGDNTASIQGIYIESSFLIGYLESQYKPTIDSALLEELVRREVKNTLKRILGAN